MHVHCLSVSNLNSCLCLRHRRHVIEYLLLFYLNVNIFFVFLILLPVLFPIVENTLLFSFLFFISHLLYLFRKGTFIFYFFFYNILLVFPQIVSSKSFPAVTSSPLLCVQLKGRRHFLPAEKTNIPTIEGVWMEGDQSQDQL